LASIYSPWLPAQAIESVKRLGQYSFSPAKGLRVISVNTNYCYTLDFFTYINYFTPNVDDILSWIVKELTAAEAAGEAVWIIGHHSPGTKDCLENWSHGFYEIVRRFSPNTIAGMFYGHLHTDEFEMFYSSNTNRTATTAINTAYVSPSLAPYTNLNPGFRVYKISSTTHRVVDSLTYISPDFSTTTTEPTWSLEYSAREAYASARPGKELDAGFWHRVTEGMERDDAVFEKFHQFRFKSVAGKVPVCDAKCREDSVCRARAGKSEQTYVTPSFEIEIYN
ncbi:hypothetical protein HDU67_000545, partial [Dinochytrium kinnereticum]